MCTLVYKPNNETKIKSLQSSAATYWEMPYAWNSLGGIEMVRVFV